MAPNTVATGCAAMVATAFPAASDAGLAMLDAGGTAVDAALAAAWALAVCEPSGSGVGGQTVLLLRRPDGTAVVLDGHSRAPAAASRQTISRAEQHAGHRATTVPTTVATLAHAQARFGSLRLDEVLQPAICLAEDGYAITALQRRQLGWCRRALRRDRAAARFLRPDGRRPRAGDVFRQPLLAEALRRLARDGADDFYRGAIARAIGEDMARHGGVLTAEDLEALGPPAEREPLRARIGDADVLTAPAPAGGEELVRALQAAAAAGAGAAGLAADWQVALAKATFTAFATREAAAERRPRRRARLTAALAATEGSGETTHICAADAAGNVVSLTQSIQSLFGAKVANERYGFLYNNYLTTCPRRPHRHRLGAGALARSNAVPTLALDARDGRPLLAVGAAGSRRILSATLHVLSGVLERGLALDEAVAHPRVHARLDRVAWAEDDVEAGVGEALARAGFAVERRARRSFAMGAVQAIAWRPDGTLVGAADPRRDGEARGR